MNDVGAPSAADIEGLVAAGRLHPLIAMASAARAPAQRRWLLDALDQALLLADPGAVSTAQRDAAVALGVDPSVAAVADLDPPPHAVMVPFAPTDGGSGVVRMVYVAWRATGDGDADGVFGAESKSAIRRALELAEGFAPPPGERGRYGLSAAQPAGFARLRVNGASLGAAAFVSAVAAWSRHRVRAGTVLTGELTATGVASVGGLRAKVEAALHRPDTRRLVVPAKDVPAVRAILDGVEVGGGEFPFGQPSPSSVEVVGVGSLRGLLDATLEPAAVPERPDDAVAEARRTFERGWQGWRWPAQREPLERLIGELPEWRPDLRVEALVLLGAVTRHLGAPDESLTLLEHAMAIVESDEGREAVPDLPLTELYQHLALTLRQLCRFGDASKMASRAVSVAQRGRLRGELLEAHGCAGLVQLSRGRAADAVGHQRAALDLVHRHRPRSCPRTHGYLVEALGRSGDLDGARAQFDVALEHLAERVEGPRRHAREAWLRTSFATALAAHERWEEVREALEADCITQAMAHDPLPGLVARRWLGLARAASPDARDPERGWELLAASPGVHGRGALPHVRFLAHLNVLHEARSRVGRGALDRDATERTRVALRHLPRYGAAEALLGAHLRRVERALTGTKPPAATGRALDRLLARCDRIA